MIETFGGLFTDTTLLQELVQPLVFVIVTEYVPALVAVIHCVLAPVLHKYAVAPAGAHKFVEPPAQIVELPLILQFIGVPTDITLLHELLHPFDSTTVTE